MKELAQALEEFQRKLIEHQDLWGDSLDQPIPDYPVRNIDELEEQSRWLSRRVGALRPYIERFDDNWVMYHPATGTRWNALDSAAGLDSVAQVKGPSIDSTIQKLDQIIGRLQSMEPEDDTPEGVNQPIRPGVEVNYPAMRKKLESVKKALFDLPFDVGASIKWVSTYLGIKRFLWILAGGVIVSGSVFVGIFPEVLVSSKYKAPTQPPVLREKLKGQLDIEFKRRTDFAETRWRWINDHISKLDKEGVGEFVSVVVEYGINRANDPFDWVVKVSAGFKVSIRAAYRETMWKGRPMLEVLAIKKDAEDEVVIRVGEGEPGDRLRAVVLVTGVGQKLPENLRKVLSSEAR